MAQDSVVITPDLISAENALAAFDEAKVDVDAAFWFLDSDDEWWFYVHTTLDDLSRRDVYGKLLDALTRFPGALPLEDIKLLPSQSDLLRALRSTYSVGLEPLIGDSPSSHRHIVNTTVGGVFVRYLILYRL